MKPMLGDKVREIVSGREGTITGQCVYLWGCEQFLLAWPDPAKEGYIESEWYDIARLEVIEPQVMAPIAHEGVFVAGPDKPAPIR